MKSIRKPKPKSRENVLSPEERKRLVSAIRTEDEELAVKGLLFTGMRVSEFSHLRRDWINWDKGIITIPFRMPCGCSHSCTTARYQYEKRNRKTGEIRKLSTPKLLKPANTWQAKTTHASRTIPIIPETEDLFRKFFKEHESVTNFLYNRINIWRIVCDVKERARIAHPVFPHSLRSSFASLLADKGFDVFTVQAVMGWKDIKMAQIYISMSGSAIKEKFNERW